ncbi:MAG: hypothetical protein DRO67_03485 [Candidatus Asgardarchaeum californiense]|nr:MAG: hypothetical protein DRO67_03485 [Candidatus Asgardarchaeum californiense]
MPTLDDYQRPRFIPYREGWTLTRRTNDRYMMFDNQRDYRNGQPQPGYNAQNPSTQPERVDFRTDEVKLRPLIVDRYAN